MKVVAKKQTKIILVISLILLLLIGLVVIFKDRIILFSKIKSFGKLDKYSHLIDDCEVEKKKGEVVLHCKGVLKRIRTDQEEKCLDFEFLINEDTDLREETLCIANDALDWDDSYGKAPWYIPTKIRLLYITEKESNNILKKIELQVIPDEELDVLFKKNKALKEIAGKIITKFFKNISENNYYTSKIDPIENIPITQTNFYGLILKSVSIIDSRLKLLFEITIQDKIYNVVFYADRLFYQNHDTKSVMLIGPNDYSKLVAEKSYVLATMSSDSIFPRNIAENFCANVHDSFPKKTTAVESNLLPKPGFIFCTVMPENLEGIHIANIGEYIFSVIQKTDKAGEQEIILDKFLPYLILSLNY